MQCFRIALLFVVRAMAVGIGENCSCRPRPPHSYQLRAGLRLQLIPPQRGPMRFCSCMGASCGSGTRYFRRIPWWSVSWPLVGFYLYMFCGQNEVCKPKVKLVHLGMFAQAGPADNNLVACWNAPTPRAQAPSIFQTLGEGPSAVHYLNHNQLNRDVDSPVFNSVVQNAGNRVVSVRAVKCGNSAILVRNILTLGS